MIKSKKIFYGILAIVLIIAGIGLLIYLYLSELRPEEELYPEEEIYTKESKELISCKDSLDCPSGMKCENYLCVNVGCIGEGMTGPSAGINPEWLNHLPTECCAGLKSIKYPGLYDENWWELHHQCALNAVMGSAGKEKQNAIV